MSCFYACFYVGWCGFIPCFFPLLYVFCVAWWIFPMGFVPGHFPQVLLVHEGEIFWFIGLILGNFYLTSVFLSGNVSPETFWGYFLFQARLFFLIAGVFCCSFISGEKKKKSSSNFPYDSIFLYACFSEFWVALFWYIFMPINLFTCISVCMYTCTCIFYAWICIYR